MPEVPARDSRSLLSCDRIVSRGARRSTARSAHLGHHLASLARVLVHVSGLELHQHRGKSGPAVGARRDEAHRLSLLAQRLVDYVLLASLLGLLRFDLDTHRAVPKRLRVSRALQGSSDRDAHVVQRGYAATLHRERTSDLGPALVELDRLVDASVLAASPRFLAAHELRELGEELVRIERVRVELELARLERSGVGRGDEHTRVEDRLRGRRDWIGVGR